MKKGKKCWRYEWRFVLIRQTQHLSILHFCKRPAHLTVIKQRLTLLAALKYNHVKSLCTCTWFEMCIKRMHGFSQCRVWGSFLSLRTNTIHDWVHYSFRSLPLRFCDITEFPVHPKIGANRLFTELISQYSHFLSECITLDIARPKKNYMYILFHAKNYIQSNWRKLSVGINLALVTNWTMGTVQQ